VNYTDRAGDTVVARYRVSAGNPDLADAASAVVLLAVDQPYANHNGGGLRFGPDGYLYIGLGDGGSGGDPENRSQDLGTLLGKMLRIDVDHGSPYAIPPSNPFLAWPGARPEIWAYGLRNPWRFSFDRLTGDLFIGDVGQNAWEEIDVQLAASGGGQNYGWRRMEGPACYNPSTGCNDGSLVLPILYYPHSAGCSVTAGFRYRGARSPALNGLYLYGDYCTGRIWEGWPTGGGGWASAQVVDTPYTISTFGEDAAGDLYLADYAGGAVYRIVGPAPVSRRALVGRPDFNDDHRSDAAWRHQTTGQVYHWLMDGATIAGQGAVGTVADPAWQIAGLADFDGDGRSDILWRHAATGQVYVWLVSGTTAISSGAVGTVADLGWKIVGVGDVDDDLRADILWRHATTGQVYLWRMNGTSIVGQGPIAVVVDSGWQMVAVADLSGDGRADILWRHQGSGQVYLWIMNGDGITAQGTVSTVPDLGWHIEGVADYDGGGRADILWRHSTTGQVYLWIMNGTGITTQGTVGTVPDLGWQIAGVGDYHGGGRADILWRHRTTGQVYLWAMDGLAISSQGPVATVSDLGWQITAP
jgi:hypothetical protein